MVDGEEYEVDCLIYATGFEVGTEYTRRAGYELYGRGGVTLTEKWADGVSTLHGLHSRGFPNCFIISQRAVRLHGQLPAHAQRAEQAPRLHRHPAQPTPEKKPPSPPQGRAESGPATKGFLTVSFTSGSASI